jgi:hypothetical protein
VEKSEPVTMKYSYYVKIRGSRLIYGAKRVFKRAVTVVTISIEEGGCSMKKNCACEQDFGRAGDL